MPEKENQARDLYSAILNSAATIAVISASLYYVGYLYLLGFYKTFGIPIDSLSLSFQVIASQSRVVLSPIIIIFLGIYINSKIEVTVNIPLLDGYISLGGDNNLNKLLNEIKRFKFLLIPGTFLLILIFSLALPQIGESRANAQINNIENDVDSLIFLESPLPKVVVYSTELLPFLDLYAIDNSTKNSTYIYKDLKLVTSTEKCFYLFSGKNETYQIPREKVMLVYLR